MSRDIFLPSTGGGEVLVASSPWQCKAIELMRSGMAMLRAGTTLCDSRGDASIALARCQPWFYLRLVAYSFFSVIRGGIA